MGLRINVPDVVGVCHPKDPQGIGAAGFGSVSSTP
jgi:hypothetical protein